MADFAGKDTNVPNIGAVFPRTCRDVGLIRQFTAQGAGTTQDDQVNASSRGVIVVLDITAKSGTIDVVVTVQRKDVTSGKYTDLLSSTSQTATGTTTLKVTPDIAASANAIAQDFIGENWAVKVVSGAGSSPSWTGTLSACLIP